MKSFSTLFSSMLRSRSLLFVCLLYIFFWRHRKEALSRRERALQQAPSPVSHPHTPGGLELPGDDTHAAKVISTIPGLEAPDWMVSTIVRDLVEQADRFTCAPEMVTFLSVMHVGGPRQILGNDEQHGCEDDLELALLLYAAWSGANEARRAEWQRKGIIHHDLFEKQIMPTREALLQPLVPRDKQCFPLLQPLMPKNRQRPIDFALLDKVRILCAHYLATHHRAEVSSAKDAPCLIRIKPEWLPGLEQIGDDHLTAFIVQQTRQAETTEVRSWHEQQRLFLAQPVAQVSSPFGHPPHAQGDRVHGTVKYLRGDHALIRLTSGILGILHKNEIWQQPRDGDVSTVLFYGQEVEVLILTVDYEQERLELSLKLPENDPLRQYVPGQYVRGKIDKTIWCGVRVQFEDGIHGLIYRKLLDDAAEEIKHLVTPGRYVTVQVLDVNVGRRHVELGLPVVEMEPPQAA